MNNYLGGVSRYFDLQVRFNVTDPVTSAAAYTAKTGDVVVLDTRGGDVTVHLPEITPDNKGQVITFTFSPTAQSGGADILPHGAQTLNGIPASSFPGISAATDIAFAIISDGVSDWLTLWYDLQPA